ncbi:phosphoethanolamine--lipid A transferase [Shewanella eurypsychrophilus]|uniref:Phosphoethanolamine--lipid A transferase n=1 Tax=Shewanella eurypsychrophilus TaxID=2593656 RepID=A0ABX8S425_9GAMM|nr:MULTISPECIES: phosphoethanolamine--lipid A transferase [Shewanella]QFU24162.1 phosphoethanolamine--lipid A transferase [Shewanella sp. YLB-09]QXP44905.1 phosphoethanolamine--lipid A transferase [Shewanella eurypsychrophilus]
MSSLLNYFSKYPLSTNQLIMLVALYFTLVFNFPFLQEVTSTVLALENYNLLFLATVPVLAFNLCTLLFCFFSARPILKPSLICLTLISSLVFYAKVSYGVIFDYGMIQNSAETHTAEALSYLNWHVTAFFVFTGVLPAAFILLVKIKHYPRLMSLLSRIKLIAISIASIIIIAAIFYPNYASVGRNHRQLQKSSIPFQYLVDSIKYTRDQYFTEPRSFNTLDSAPRLITSDGAQKKVIVMVIGETARAQNFAYNGYDKPTNKATEKYGLISFEKMFSCGTATAVSVPCMFSSLTRSNFDKIDAENEQNLLDLVSLAGVDVLWVDNNGCKGVCKRVPTINIDVKSNNPLCDGDYCFDEVLIEPLQNKLAALSAPTTLIVLHMIGSHGPTYFRRYPSETRPFKDDCQRSDIQNCSPETLLNTYDNTIAYTDLVLSKIIESLNTLPEDVQPSMLYVSDHGESLGESGAYLHGFPYAFAPDEQKHIPLLAWFPEQRSPYIDTTCLQRHAKRDTFSHDNIFHSMLGILNVDSTQYDRELDLFASCMSPQTRDGTRLTSNNMSGVVNYSTK